MKRVFIIHGWDGYPEEGWFPWLKKELESKGCEVCVPAMPDPAEPKIETWVPFLRELVGEVDENTFFVGHSIGCQTILRFIESLPENAKIGGAVFVAGWYNLRNLETEEEERIAGPWVNTPRNDEKIRKFLEGKSIAIFSDNDPWVIPENQNSWKEKVGAEIIIEHNRGHFSGNDGITELPSARDALLKVADFKIIRRRKFLWEKPDIINEVGFDFHWDVKKVWALDIPATEMDINELVWHFDIPFWELADTDDYNLTPNAVINKEAGTHLHREKIEKADTSFPIDIMENKGRWLILDGLHRLVKLYENGAEKIMVRIIPREKIPEITREI